MASSRPWPFDDDDDRPSGSVRPLSQADLQAILAHLGDDPDQLLVATGADRPVVAVRVRASVGRPGGSAHAQWRQRRAAEWAAWTRSLPWRTAAVAAGGLGVGLLATQQANRAHDRERELRQHQHVRDGWLEANAHLGRQYRQVVRTLAWQRRATGLAIEAERPGYVLEALGPVPESTRGRRAWRQAAAEIQQYRHTYQVTDPDRALGPEPHDPAQRADRQRARLAIDRIQAKQRAADRTHDQQDSSERTNRPQAQDQRRQRGPERAAG